ncbi:MAG TPA: ThiF family adenylyltransferase [Candidatus Nitrosopolaris sp.]|nr:ThiF family adenylyltransferase [Candidatus Nitrosopolaris sp.]
MSNALSLTEAQIERYGRQILLPEIGGRGQRRLLAAHVALAGAGEAATAAAVLLERAGVGTLDLLGQEERLPELGPDCRVRWLALDDVTSVGSEVDVLVDLAGGDPRTATLGRRVQAAGRPVVVGVLAGARAAIATLIGSPCVVCLPRPLLALERADVSGPLAAPTALAAGALAASETLALLLFPRARGRLHILDSADGQFTATPLEPTAGCPVCRGR